MILEDLLQNLDTILYRITISHLSRYDILQSALRTNQVDSDRTYQRIFNAFYRMQRRTKEWYTYYFSMLESTKNKESITFKCVLEQIYADTKRVEPSFSSKLVATIRPQLPVYDRHVKENLSLNVPPQHRPAIERVNGFIRMYAALEGRIDTMIRSPIFMEQLKPAFDKKFGDYVRFTDAKKLDFLLWQHRPAKNV